MYSPEPSPSSSLRLILNSKDVDPYPAHHHRALKHHAVRPDTYPPSRRSVEDYGLGKEDYRLRTPAAWPSDGSSGRNPNSVAGPSYQHQASPRVSPFNGLSPRQVHSPMSPTSPTLSYGSPSIAPISPIFSDMRTGIYTTGDRRADAAIPALPRDYSHKRQQSSASSQSSHERGSPEIDATEWQATERASVRLAAAPAISYSQYYSEAQRCNGRQLSPTFQTHSTDRTRPSQRSQKRGAFDVFDGEDAEEPPKSKRKLSAKPREKPGPNKRVYTTKKRSEAAQMAALNETAPSTVAIKPPKPNENEAPYYQTTPLKLPTDLNLKVEIQDARCMANRYRDAEITRCVSCIRRWAGDTCRFQGVRAFFRDSSGNIRGFGFQEEYKDDESPRLEFPDEWNIPLHDDHIHETKKTIAAALLPTLREELKHIGQEGVVYRPRESDVRATCDTCLTSIFCSSWMCRLCGREACAECFQQVKNLTTQPDGASESQLKELQALRDKQNHDNPTFLMCMRKKDHSAKNFSPMSRFSQSELTQTVNAMAKLLQDEGITLAQPSVAQASSQSDQASTSNSSAAQTPADAAPSPLSNDSEATLISDSDIALPVASGSRTEIPAHEIRRFKDSELTEEVFRSLWVQGDPLLVTDVGRKLNIDWSPEYFVKKYGTQSCLIIECQTDENKRITVADFFSGFGKYDGRDRCWKLKDWPPSSDFQTAFPELYEDFSQAVPMPNYVRRDGALNLASHFHPTPSVLISFFPGPKMYNANANREAGSKGSTRLHMDMADALNIMTYAAPDPDGKEGCAAWDLFRAQDSNQIRQFMRAKFSTTGLDPIHSQQVYLDDEARRELWEQHGVKSYRVYQKAGEAVFIPAGCAHQVRNLSDCIKVAIDFVSPENISRCEKLTREFREQNHKKAWKEDVLQLRTMMWFAWLSCCRQERLAVS
ncbi:hypothetical protein FB451DRAFT_1205305 [Mycena latifolia]|nr:hypothetical protein FB451DRAFT_1205305 [Mycena latifolia]